MKLDKFDIKFDKHHGVFTAGETVSGHVIVQSSSNIQISDLKIQFLGKAIARWNISNEKGNYKYGGEETYFNETFPLLVLGPSPVYSIGTGLHKFPFAFVIDKKCPSSLESLKGYVRYMCKATVERRHSLKMHESVKKTFTVIQPYDLNALENYRRPIIGNVRIALISCYCCDGGFVNAQLKLPKTGFVPGEQLIYQIKINNQSTSDITFITVLLQQATIYTGHAEYIFVARGPQKHTETVDITLLENQIHISSGNATTIKKTKELPPLPPSELKGCNIIDLKYYLIVRIPCATRELEIKKEIVMGTIPIREVPVITQPQPSVSTLPLPPTAPPMPLSSSYEDPPPSYEECVFGKVQVFDENDDENTVGQSSWAPAYPVYHRSTSQSYDHFFSSNTDIAHPDRNQI